MFDYQNADAQNDEEPEDDQATEESDQFELAIKLNEESSAFECAVCGDARTSAQGPELFLADTWDLVCDECGRKYAPLLMAMIDLGAAAEGYVAVRETIPPQNNEKNLAE
jgi:hypothetical protein